jgi:hypothetical protein
VGAPPAALEVKLQLSSSLIRFLQEGQPGVLAADQPLNMDVTCFSQSWAVSAQATPLVEQQGLYAIGPERLFVSSPLTAMDADLGAGAGFAPLEYSVVVGAGAQPVDTLPLDFRLFTTWHDPPGTYEGEIIITAIAVP